MAAGESAHEWLEEEASYLEKGLLRSYARLAQVRLEIQVRASAKGLRPLLLSRIVRKSRFISCVEWRSRMC